MSPADGVVDGFLIFLRDRLLQSELASRAIQAPVSIYRRCIYYVGPKKRKFTLGNGETVAFHSETPQEIRHFYPVYGELSNLNRFIDDLHPDDVVYDIGAHVGIYSCVAAQMIDDSQIYAFEPHPANVDRLKENGALNDANIRTFRYALSNISETKKFAIDADESGAVGHSDPSLGGKHIVVEFVRGADLVREQNLPRPTVLKIDVEGAELEVLKGLDGVLDDCRVIYCEVSDQLEHYGSSREQLLQFLKDRGFEIEFLGDGTVEHIDVRAVR